MTLDEPSAQWWEDEYAREITKGHPLYGVPVKALAYERVWGIFHLLRHESEYAVVELTLSGQEERAPHVPAFVLYRDLAHLLRDCIAPQHSEWREEVREFISTRGHFSVGLAPHNYDVGSSLPAHEQVLRPLLGVADECWVYGVSSDCLIWAAALDILEPHRGKHRIRLDVESIVGHELFWNARGGKRGTIVILCGTKALLKAGVLRHCARPYICGNMATGHTPSAVRLAKQAVHRPETVALLLSRNNGLEWIDIIAEPDVALSLFDHAYSQHHGFAEPDAGPNSRPPSQLATSPEAQPPDSQRTPSSGGCG